MKIKAGDYVWGLYNDSKKEINYFYRNPAQTGWILSSRNIEDVLECQFVKIKVVRSEIIKEIFLTELDK